MLPAPEHKLKMKTKAQARKQQTKRTGVVDGFPELVHEQRLARAQRGHGAWLNQLLALRAAVAIVALACVRITLEIAMACLQ